MRPLRVGIAGLGRIGRGILRANHTKFQEGRFDICVVCDIMPIDQVAYLLAHDSTYGKPPFSLDFKDNDLIIGDKKVHYARVDRRRRASEDGFAEFREFDLDVFVDATGTATIADLRAIIERKVARKVVCTANVAGCDISLVFGVNDDQYDPAKHDVIASNTCTGNALAPVAYVLDKHFGIDYARIVTLHPALSDQRALDGYHVVPELGRSCAASILPTSTQVAASTVMALRQISQEILLVMSASSFLRSMPEPTYLELFSAIMALGVISEQVSITWELNTLQFC
jgi:glyceraldehyde 3-phosphate dehydrogenase